MSDDSSSPAGPLYGPDFVVVMVDDGAGALLGVQVRPDANNVGIKAAGWPTRYYFEPPRVVLAPRLDSDHLDFSMKAMVKPTSGAPGIEYVGGSCTFTTTAALPDTAAEQLVRGLVAHDHATPAPRLAELFNHADGDPDPEVVPVPVNVAGLSCTVDSPRPGGEAPVTGVQQSAGGSIEVGGRSTFLVSFNGPAIETAVTDLRNGSAPPFTLRYLLTEVFDTGGGELTGAVRVDLAGFYDAVAAALTDPPAVTPDAIRSALRSDALQFRVSDGAAPVDAGITEWLTNTDSVRKGLLAAVRDELFDTVAPAVPVESDPNPPWWKLALHGAAAVTLKKDRPKSGTAVQQNFSTGRSLAAEYVVDGRLEELAAAAKTDLDEYLTVVTVGGF